jgi:hypothetical protein
MPKSSARGKYNRSKARARARRSPRRAGTGGWTMGVAAIVILGIVGIVLTKGSGSSSGLTVNDHWHAAFGVNVCGTWLPNPPETPRDGSGTIVRQGTATYAGLHTHGDGLIHMEPQASDDTGSHATVGRYFKYEGFKLSSTSFTYVQGVTKGNGDACPAANGQPETKGTVTWAVNGKEHTGNLADYRLKNNDRIVLAFGPAGKNAASLGDPPSVANLPNGSRIENPSQVPTVPSSVPTPASSTPASSTPSTSAAPTTAKP